MNPQHPALLHHSEWDRALFGMVLVSLVAHAAAVALVMLLPGRFTLRPRPIPAYVVDLVNADQLAGTNLVAGSKGKVEAPPKVVEPPKPPPPPPKIDIKPPEPPPPKAEVKKEEPKPVEDDKAVKLAVATQPKPAQPTPTPVVQAKAEVAKPQPNAKPVPVAIAPTPAPPKKPIGTPTMTKAEVAAHDRDAQIAKAIQRRAEQAGSGSGTGKTGDKPGGGPISTGPGKGEGGGVIVGVEFILYQNQIRSRLKEAWAWAGSNQNLEAVVRFRIADDGEISDVRITRASGDATYDATVMRAVRAVSPMAPPPERYRKEFSDVEITFTPKDAT